VGIIQLFRGNSKFLPGAKIFFLALARRRRKNIVKKLDLVSLLFLSPFSPKKKKQKKEKMALFLDFSLFFLKTSFSFFLPFLKRRRREEELLFSHFFSLF